MSNGIEWTRNWRVWWTVNFLLSAQQRQWNARYFVRKVDHHQPRSCPSPSTSEHIRAVHVGMFYSFRVAPLFGFEWFLKTLLFLVPFYPPLFPIYSTSVVDDAVHSQHQRHFALLNLYLLDAPCQFQWLYFIGPHHCYLVDLRFHVRRKCNDEIRING